MKVSMNDFVQFKPTQFGIEAHFRYWVDYKKRYNSKLFIPLKIDSEGYATLQLREICNYFGSVCELGESPFAENNELIILEQS